MRHRRRSGKKPARQRKPVANLSTFRKKMEATGVQPDPPHFQEAGESRFDRR